MPSCSLVPVRLCVASLAVAVSLACTARATRPEPEAARAAEPRATWNVVLITVDALRADRMSLYGNERRTTPQLDAFARDAAVFENFFAVSAHTSPGVVSLLTGQNPPVHAQTTQYSFYDALIPSPLRALAARGYDVVGYAMRGATYSELGFTRGQDGMPTEQLLEQLAASERPFFAWLHTRETHLPYKPAAEFGGRFTRGLKLDSPLLRAVREHAIVLRDASVQIPYRHAGQVAARPGDAEPLRALYDECVASADARVGAWLAQLRAAGLLERTLVVITADHGEELLEHGWVGHASTGYDAKLTDEVLHIPLIVRVPGGAHAGRYRALASQVDVMPTLFELLGIDGSELAPNQQGVSLAPVMRGEQPEVREFVFAETTRKGWTTPRAETRRRVVALRTHDRKLIVADGATPAAGGSVHFYDLARDPGELENLNAARAPRSAELAPSLDWLSREVVLQIQRHRAAAQRSVEAAARERLALQDAGSARDDATAVVAQWQAIARQHATWGLERDPFYAGDTAWSALREQAAELAARAMRCEAHGQPTSSPECARSE